MKKKPNPIPTEEDYCEICGTPYAHTHEIFFGNPNAALSQEYGLTMRLCQYHHQDSKAGIHFNKEFREESFRRGQQVFKERYPELDFCKTFQCKDYLSLSEDDEL